MDHADIEACGIDCDKAEVEEPGPGLKIRHLDEFFNAKETYRRAEICLDDGGGLDPVEMRQTFVTHDQDQQDIQEGLSCRKGIRIIHPMPYEIKSVGGKAHQEDPSEEKEPKALSRRDLIVNGIQGHQKKREAPAVDVRPMLQCAFCIDGHAMSCDHVEDREVRLPFLREVHVAKVRGHKRADLRHEEDGRKRSRKERPKREFPDHGKAALLRKEQIDEVQDEKQADHDGNIEIGKNAKGERKDVKSRLPLVHQPLQAK